MKKLSLLSLVLLAFAFAGCSDDDKALLVTSFEGKLTTANSEFQATGGTSISEGYYATTFKDPSNTLEFTHSYGNWGFGGGFTYCNYADATTAGFGNISAITAKGKQGSTYLTATQSNTIKMTLLKPEAYSFKGLWITNSTYAYLAVKDGNDGSTPAFVTKFKAGDWFKVTAIGYDSTEKKIGQVEFYLADFRNGQTNIVNSWEWFDLSSIASAQSITFELSSTDNGDRGMNTPGYFCLDAITLEEK